MNLDLRVINLLANFNQKLSALLDDSVRILCYVILLIVVSCPDLITRLVKLLANLNAQARFNPRENSIEQNAVPLLSEHLSCHGITSLGLSI